MYDDRIYWKEALSLQKAGYSVTHISIGTSSFEMLTKEGIQAIQIAQKRYFKNPYGDKAFRLLTLKKSIAQKVFEKASELKADVYHLHDLQLNKIGQKLKELPHRPKVIYDVHEPYPITLSTYLGKNPIIKVIYQLFRLFIHHWELSKARNYDQIIATEKIVARKFKNENPNVPVEIIYNYSELKVNQPAESKCEYDFIYCGGIMERRGVLQIIEAIKLLNEAGLPSRTLFIGPIKGAGLKSKIDQLIQTYQLSENITFQHSVPYDEVAEWYTKARIGFCLFNNTQVNHIIMPIKLFEYLVCGLPVICSNFGKMKEVTEANNTGIMVDPDNPQELVRAMKELLTNQEKYNALQTNCLKAAPNYRWEIMEKRLVELYKNICPLN